MKNSYLTLGMLQQTSKHYLSPPISYSLGRNTDEQAELQLNVKCIVGAEIGE